jgi:hypothetical protein
MALRLGDAVGGMSEQMIAWALVFGLVFSGWKLGSAICDWLDGEEEEKKSGQE